MSQFAAITAAGNLWDIVSIGSGAGFRDASKQVGNGAAEAGLCGLARPLAAEHADNGIQTDGVVAGGAIGTAVNVGPSDEWVRPRASPHPGRTCGKRVRS